MWKFDKHVSTIYPGHVLQHIPNYQTVIDKSLECCRDVCNPHDPILDFGCATGYTLQRLHDAGFTNLTGVDNSQDMLDACNVDIARLVCSDTIPEGQYKAIIANWTLHFNANKEQLLRQAIASLQPGGMLFLTEKTISSDFVKTKYYEWKHSQGVSWEGIIEKEQQLEGQMFLQTPNWYLTFLHNQGLCDLEIVDASWGFVSFIAFKG